VWSQVEFAGTKPAGPSGSTVDVSGAASPLGDE